MPFIILTTLICIIVAVFALQNSVVVPVKFIFVEQEASLVLVILFSVLLGLLLGASMFMYVKFRSYLDTRKKNDEIKQLKEANVLLNNQVGTLEKRVDDLLAGQKQPVQGE